MLILYLQKTLDIEGLSVSLIAIKLFFSGLLSFLFTYYLVPIFIAIACKYNIVDLPDGKIKQHQHPTPYLGGAAVYLGFLSTLAIVFPFDNQFFLFLVGSSLLFYLGLIDDLIVLRPSQKFVGQTIAVLCFLRAGFYLKAHIFYNFWSIPFSAFWMLLIINAFNLIDIMDGLASIVAIFCSINFLLIALCTKQYTAALLLCAIIGSISAFFCFNKPRASIYLGDAGSLFTGGLLSTIPFLFPWGSINSFGYIIPIVVLAIPLLEVCGLIFIRTCKGIAFYKPSKDHFAHYLRRKQFSEYGVLKFVVVASMSLIAASTLFVEQCIKFEVLGVLGALFLIIWICSLYPKKRLIF